mmetsp:Transcript_99128/g.280735  ORF Transcript_99128/g.280735 Transcript_99128/m.280735 type:complete len:202 (-) Transcript_99128:1069-1674(-)
MTYTGGCHLDEDLCRCRFFDVEQVPCPAEDGLVGGDGRHSAAPVHVNGLRVDEGPAALGQVPESREVLVVRQPRRRLLAYHRANVISSQHHLIPVEIILVTLQGWVDTHCLPHVCVNVVEMVIVVAAKVVFHALFTVDEKVVVSPEIGAPVIVIDVLLRRVVVNEEIVVDLPPGHDHRRLPSPDGCQVRLAIPRIERAMVA